MRDSGVGCKINNCYTGAISYADDITLSCPSIRGLNKMLDICNKFAEEHYLIFNSKKSLTIKYGKEVNNTEYVLLGHNRINWVDSVRHLGNYFNTQLSDITDCMMKRSTFIGSVNKLMANFGHLQYVRFLRHSVATFMGPQFGTLILLGLERCILPGTLDCVQY